MALLEERDVDFFAPEPEQVDSSDEVNLARTITQSAPGQVINLVSYGGGKQSAIAQAESNPDDNNKLNFLQPTVLAQVCDHLNVPLIHVASSYVCNGEKKLGYNEQDEANPKGKFGKASWKGEGEIRKHINQHIILRSGWVFGKCQDESIRNWITQFIANQGELSLLRRKFSPTPSKDLARVILAICQQVDCAANLWGVYHYCGLETKKEIEFVQQVLKIAAQYDEKVYELLNSLKLTEANISLPELANTTLSSKKIFDAMGIKQRSWHGELQDLIKGFYQH